MINQKSKKGQVAIFIIIAIVVVVGVGLYFVLRGGDLGSGLSKNMEPVYDYYLSCLEQTADEGISLLGEQGGYIYVEEMDFVPGSQYRPFSSQLDFLGQPVPYWMYVSGNNLLKEQVPTKRSMEEELERYLEERVGECDFFDFESQGFDVFVDDGSGGGSVSVDINDLSVDISIKNQLLIYFEDQSGVVGSHSISVNSKLGKFYGLALEVYNHEKQEMFLEKYALDVMRLYAPVTGVEIGCSPKIFVDEEIREDIVLALMENIPFLKLKGSYYELSNPDNKYFVTDVGVNVDENVNFLYIGDWPAKIEIYGDKVVSPVGLQQGMGLLGFCYVPYHLVYDIDFPVLIQFYSSDGNVFQFPIAVVIEKNQERTSLPTSEGINIESEVCGFKNQEVDVYTYDSSLEPVEARIQFKCLNSICEIGNTVSSGGDAILSAGMPQCVNGFIVASAEGYASTKYQISTNEDSLANIIMRKLYKVDLDLGEVEKALVTFKAKDYSATVLYPDTKEVELTEGYYNVSVVVYKGSTLVIPAVSNRECVDVPQSGIGGVLGLQTEKCFDINLPGTDVDFAVVGGGKTQEYLAESSLQGSTELNINVPLFGVPTTLDGLQENYVKAEDETIYLEFE